MELREFSIHWFMVSFFEFMKNETCTTCQEMENRVPWVMQTTGNVLPDWAKNPLFACQMFDSRPDCRPTLMRVSEVTESFRGPLSWSTLSQNRLALWQNLCLPNILVWLGRKLAFALSKCVAYLEKRLEETFINRICRFSCRGCGGMKLNRPGCGKSFKRHSNTGLWRVL